MKYNSTYKRKQLAFFISIVVTILVLFSSANSSSSCLYYQDKYALRTCDSLVTLLLEGDEVNLFGGIVSSSGRYIGGSPMDSASQEYIDNYMLIGRVLISQHLQYPFRDYLLYDRNRHRVVVYLDSIDLDFRSAIFSENEEWFWADFSGSGDTCLVINMERASIDTVLLGHFESVKWFDNKLYSTAHLNESVITQVYDPVSGELQELLRYSFQDNLTRRKSRVFLLNPKCIAIETPLDSDGQNILLVCQDSDEMHYDFDCIYSINTCDRYLYVMVGQKELWTKEDFSKSVKMYRIVPNNSDINLLFTGEDLMKSEYSDEFWYPGPRWELSCAPSEILFITSHLELKNKNLFRWTTTNKTFERLTDSGYISGPIGRVR